MELRPALLEAKHKPREEEQKGLRDRVVRGTMDVSSSFQDSPDPTKGFRELMASSVLEEEAQYVATYHRVYSVFEVGEEGLMASGSLSRSNSMGSRGALTCMIPSGDRRPSILSITALATLCGRPRMVIPRDVVSASSGNVVCVRTGGPNGVSWRALQMLLLLPLTNEEVPRARMLFEIDQRSVTQVSGLIIFSAAGSNLPVSGNLKNEKLRKILLDRHTSMRVRREILRMLL
jgi:hypothetical protein